MNWNKKEKEKKEDFYSRLVLPYQPGVKVSARPRAQLTLYSQLRLPTGSKSPPFTPGCELLLLKTYSWLDNRE
jgi:hypothetical protein